MVSIKGIILRCTAYQISRISILFTLDWTGPALPRWGVEMDSSTETTSALLLGRTRNPTSHHLWLCSKGMVTSLSCLSRRSWNVLTRFSCPSLSTWDEFGNNPAHIYIVLKYSDLAYDMIYLLTAIGLTPGGKLTHMKFPTCQQLHGLWFFCFRGQFPAFDSHFNFFFFLWAFRIFGRGHTAFELWTWKPNQEPAFFLFYTLQNLLSVCRRCS